jgi:hypothetical protein
MRLSTRTLASASAPPPLAHVRGLAFQGSKTEVKPMFAIDCLLHVECYCGTRVIAGTGRN